MDYVTGQNNVVVGHVELRCIICNKFITISVQCPTCGIGYCSEKCRLTHLEQHKYICDEDFHIRMQKMFLYVDTWTLFGAHSQSMITRRGDMGTFSLQSAYTEPKVIRYYCVSCGKSTCAFHTLDIKTGNGDGKMIICDKCAVVGLSICEISYLRNDLCKDKNDGTFRRLVIFREFLLTNDQFNLYDILLHVVNLSGYHICI